MNDMYESLRKATEQDENRKVDRTACMVLADWLEENGSQEEADFWRWYAGVEIRPYKFGRELRLWFSKAEGDQADPPSDLPEELADRMQGEVYELNRWCKQYDSEALAVHTLFCAWVLLQKSKDSKPKHVTKETAQTHHIFYHAIARYKSGSKGAYQVRANGKCQTWKTRPNDYKLPIRFGFKGRGYITQENEQNFLLSDPTEENEK